MAFSDEALPTVVVTSPLAAARAGNVRNTTPQSAEVITMCRKVMTNPSVCAWPGGTGQGAVGAAGEGVVGRFPKSLHVNAI